jgi:hypothetical protein
VSLLGQWNSPRAKSCTRLLWGEERANFLLLACCYQEEAATVIRSCRLTKCGVAREIAGISSTSISMTRCTGCRHRALRLIGLRAAIILIDGSCAK